MPTLAEQLDSLTRALDATTGRVPPETEARARRLVERANRRLAAGPQTVVALAGATGSGKSSLLNALAGAGLAEQGARRPTTATTLAVSFAATNAPLLDLLGVTHRREAEPLLPGMADLVLLDLPDHDSAARSHREEVDRMVAAADQLIWVLDPQKYADAAVHERYLRRLTRHREVTFVVLNHIDRLSPEQLARCLDHVRQILADDGLAGVPLLATSTLDGRGIDSLRGQLMQLAASKRAAATRLSADVATVAAELRECLGEGHTGTASDETLARLHEHLAAAAGVPVVVKAVRDAMRHRGHLATGWPMISWIGRLRPDPLKRLRVGDDADLSAVRHSSLPARSATAQAELATGLRGLATELSEGMPLAWQSAVTQIVQSSAARLPDRLDRAVVTTDLRVSPEPVWWRLIRALQWVFIGGVVVGLAWLIVFGVLDYLGFVNGSEGLPLPAIVLLVSLAGGVLLHAFAGLIIHFAADRAAARSRRELEASIAQVARDDVVAPAEAEVARYRLAREELDGLGP